MSQYFTKYTLLLIYCAFVGLNNTLYTMHGAYTKIFCFLGYLPTFASYYLSMCVLCDTRNAPFLASVIKCLCDSGDVKYQV
jgi:hypothetical protein